MFDFLSDPSVNILCFFGAFITGYVITTRFNNRFEAPENTTFRFYLFRTIATILGAAFAYIFIGIATDAILN